VNDTRLRAYVARRTRDSSTNGLLLMKSTIRERGTCKNTFIVRCLDSSFLQLVTLPLAPTRGGTLALFYIYYVCACVRACVCVYILLALYVSFRCSFSSYIRPPHLVSFLHTHPRSRSLSCVHRGHFLYSLTLFRGRDDWSTLFLHARRLPLPTTSIYGVACAHVAAPHTSSGKR